MALVEVTVIALACMMSVLIVGEAAKPFMPIARYSVPCSTTITNMAKTMKVTLLDSCIVEER